MQFLLAILFFASTGAVRIMNQRTNEYVTDTWEMGLHTSSGLKYGQDWYLADLGNGYFSLHNDATKRCVSNEANTPDAVVTGCNYDYWSQHWRSDGYNRIINRYSGRSLETFAGHSLFTEELSNRNYQFWTITKYPSEEITFSCLVFSLFYFH